MARKKENQLVVKLVRGFAGLSPRQRKTLAALGFTKVNQELIKPDNDAIRGMIASVSHIVEVKEG